MSEICDCKCCDYQPILEKLTTDNFEKVIWDSGRKVVNRKHLTIYRVIHTGKMKSEDGEWVKCVSYTPINDCCTYYTRIIDSFIENFIPIILEDFEERLINEKDNLAEKIKKLEDFIYKNSKFLELSEDNKILMKKQCDTMYIYLNCLEARVAKILKEKIEKYDVLPSTGEEVKANVAEPANVL